MTFFNDFTKELIASGIVRFHVLIAVRIITTKLCKAFCNSNNEVRAQNNLVIKYLHLLANILANHSVYYYLSVQPKDIIIAISSITTVVGVAMFAQWSI
jgi:hypothetical protein